MRVLATFVISALFLAPFLYAQKPAESIELPAGAHLVLQAKGTGVQIYSCLNTPDGLKWVLKAPEAKLFDASGEEIGTHFAGPTWKLTDGSQVQGELLASRSSLESNSVPWLLLRAKAGTASGKLAKVAFIRRTETHGGVAPKEGCENPSQANRTISMPYTASYSFYSK